MAVRLLIAAGRVTRVPQRAQRTGWAETEEQQLGQSESEFTSALPVRGLMNRSHAVTSKRGGEAEARWNAHEVVHSLSPALS